jgi:hypothetical protein
MCDGYHRGRPSTRVLGTSGSGLKDNIVNVFGPKLVAHVMPIDLPGITYTTRKRVERSFGCVQLRIYIVSPPSAITCG